MDQEVLKTTIKDQFNSSIRIDGDKMITNLDEDEKVEFKLTFHANQNGISKQYVKTSAGFANNKGGVIIFGVDPDSKEIIGINDKYVNYDNRNVSIVFSQYLDGLSSFFFFTAKFVNKLVGFLIINEPVFKPVIVKTNFNQDGVNYVAGDIYFRYPGEDKKIHPSDLRSLITTEINRHAQNLIAKIDKIVQVGPEHVAILNSQTGEIDANGAKLTLSADLLNELNLILEGKFVESEGAPAYVIKGNIDVDNPNSTALVTRDVLTALHNVDYHDSMLRQKNKSPLHFLENIVYRDTHYLPIYFFVVTANKTVIEVIEMIESNDSSDVRPSVKRKLIERLRNPRIFLSKCTVGSINSEIIETELKNLEAVEELIKKYNMRSNSSKTVARSVAFNILREKKKIPDFITNEFYKEVLEAFSNLSKDDVKSGFDFYRKELLRIMKSLNAKIEEDINVKTVFRKLSCRLDLIMFNS